MKKVAVVLGSVALVLTITTGAFAAKGMLTGSDIQNGSITGLDMKDGSLTVRDLSPATRAALRGVEGTSGARGETGAKGETGTKGEPGEKGATGEKGGTGAKGEAGATGAAGKDGANGRDGAAGKQGPAGPQGEPGPAGAPGERGPQGPPGRSPLTVNFNDGKTHVGQVDSWREVAQTSVSTDGASLLIEFSAVTECMGWGPTCPVRVLVDGEEVGRLDQAIGRAEYRTVSAVTPTALTSGSHTVKVEVFTTNGTSFWLEDRLLKTTAL